MKSDKEMAKIMELVSVIMSTFNEPISYIEKSIESILNQTYGNIQLILINDNPNRKDLADFLYEMSKKYNNIKYLINKENLGLVKSLNKGIDVADGFYIARMDADDISKNERISVQIEFLKSNNLDLVGSNVIKIDENENEIGFINVPTKNNEIIKLNEYGSCILHPTWLGKKSVFKDLNGYRNIFSCEDYDFITRAIRNNYKLGNVNKCLLKYRIRKDGISISSEARQKLLMYFISCNRYIIDEIDIQDIENYINSDGYKKDYRMINNFIIEKNKLLTSCNYLYLFKIILNKYFYKSMRAKIKLKLF